MRIISSSVSTTFDVKRSMMLVPMRDGVVSEPCVFTLSVAFFFRWFIRLIMFIAFIDSLRKDRLRVGGFASSSAEAEPPQSAGDASGGAPSRQVGGVARPASVAAVPPACVAGGLAAGEADGARALGVSSGSAKPPPRLPRRRSTLNPSLRPNPWLNPSLRPNPCGGPRPLLLLARAFFASSLVIVV